LIYIIKYLNMEETKNIDRILKSLSEDLNAIHLPKDSFEAQALGEVIDTLKAAKFLLRLYKDR